MITTSINHNQVRGQAQIGDLVTYFDIANQDGTVWKVVALPEMTKYGFMTGYELISVDGERTNSSDLRQRGWTFYTEVQ